VCAVADVIVESCREALNMADQVISISVFDEIGVHRLPELHAPRIGCAG